MKLVIDIPEEVLADISETTHPNGRLIGEAIYAIKTGTPLSAKTTINPEETKLKLISADGDLISRQAVLDILRNNYRMKALDLIEDLPSVTPLSADGDLISREETKAEIRKKFPKLEDRTEINAVINSMPSVQPSGDLISRKEIVDMIDKLYDDFCNSDGGETSCTIDGKTYTSDMGYAFDGIEMFIEVFKKRLAEKQTAEPKSAEWIPIIDHGKDTGYIRCSACGAGEPMARFPHCPECGAEMVNWGICKGAEE